MNHSEQSSQMLPPSSPPPGAAALRWFRQVTTWFGSEDAFDETVRSSVKRALAEQLGVDAFPYAAR